MKKLLLLIATTSLMFGLSSCDELTDAFKISFKDVVIEQTLDISALQDKSTSIEGSQDAYEFNESVAFSLSDADNGTNADEVLADYLQNLSSIYVKSMTFTIVDNIPEGQTLTIESLSIKVMQGEDALYTESFSDITPGTPMETSNLNSEVFSTISTALYDSEELMITAEGSFSGDVETFQIEARIVSDIEANALDLVKSTM